LSLIIRWGLVREIEGEEVMGVRVEPGNALVKEKIDVF